MKFAQIIDGIVHGVYEYAELPVFASNIVMIDVTSRTDIEAGMKYLTDGTFDTTVDAPVTPPVLPVTDIAVTTLPARYKVGDVVTFDFTTELPNDSYFIPYRVDGDGRKYLKDAVVSLGAGSMTFTFDRGGIYYIDNKELPLSQLKVNGSETNRFTIYVAE